ncbi:unnamed protein product [Cyprideis torosa]|uniref:CLIP domain-containing serine protease n=1 Tax=Cyprideis torosa TaxID=163714 RepID=A0A7R8WKE4_9CRUS|nr:unnamed protein product [Cyprideis torosa]CAG0901253.1 unnamed protein product [Cyprideis torosa]
MKAFRGVFGVLLSLSFYRLSQGLNMGDSCRAVTSETGVCHLIKHCSTLQRLASVLTNPEFSQSRRDLALRYMKQSICGHDGGTPLLCCPKSVFKDQTAPVTVTTVSVRPSKISALKNADGENSTSSPQWPPLKPRKFGDGCSSKSYHGKIAGGKEADIGSWPWAAALGYREGSNVHYRCGATLIADGWLLTAAHCFGEEPAHVRLGDHDLYKTDESQHVDYPIIKSVVHPQFNKPSRLDNDIALIQFDSSQGYGDNVYPACLPFDITGDLSGTTPFAVGWGTTGFREYDLRTNWAKGISKVTRL